MVHEARSLETCGMSCSHILFIVEHHVVEKLGNKYAPAREFTWWPGGCGSQPSRPNVPGHMLKLLSGKGTHGTDGFYRGLKMMESTFITRVCHPPVSSYLQGSNDIEIRRVR